MRKYILPACAPIGFLIYVIFKIMERIMEIGDAIAIPMMIVSIAFMMVGVAYNGWCFGKRKSPFHMNRDEKKKEDSNK